MPFSLPPAMQYPAYRSFWLGMLASVGGFQILRGLGFGLDEKAIEEIANHWKFRPGTLNGQPVDVWAVIEVSFTLR